MSEAPKSSSSSSSSSSSAAAAVAAAAAVSAGAAAPAPLSTARPSENAKPVPGTALPSRLAAGGEFTHDMPIPGVWANSKIPGFAELHGDVVTFGSAGIACAILWYKSWCLFEASEALKNPAFRPPYVVRDPRDSERGKEPVIYYHIKGIK